MDCLRSFLGVWMKLDVWLAAVGIFLKNALYDFYEKRCAILALGLGVLCVLRFLAFGLHSLASGM